MPTRSFHLIFSKPNQIKNSKAYHSLICQKPNMNFSLALQTQVQFLHLKPAVDNCSSSFAGFKFAKTTHLLTTKQTSSSVVKGVSNHGTTGVDLFTEFQIQQVMERQSLGFIPREQTHTHIQTDFSPALLQQAYESCRKISAATSTTYYLGSLLMTEERKKAVWAVYGWGQRTDDLVDGANSSLEAAAALDTWERRLEDIYNGHPHDISDIALVDTFQRFPLDIKPFKDLMKGMKMDTWKTRYENYQELELYCYYVAATGCLMAIPIAGISPEYQSSTQTIYESSLYLGIANQLTNILRDVEEDASRGRIYLPQDELREFGLTDEDIFSKKVTKQWREFTKMQIQRARHYYDKGEQVGSQLHVSSRWPVQASFMLYKKILDKIEENDYDNLTKRATVGTAEKFVTLPIAYAKAMGWFPTTNSNPH